MSPSNLKLLSVMARCMEIDDLGDEMDEACLGSFKEDRCMGFACLCWGKG